MEKFIGSVGPVSGHTYDTLYDLVFTTGRLIAVNIKHPLDTPYCFHATDLFLGAKLSQKADRLAKIQYAPVPSANYDLDDFDGLVREHPHSFAVPFDAMSSLTIRRRFLKSRLYIEIEGALGRHRKMSFTVPRKKVGDLEMLLANVSMR